MSTAYYDRAVTQFTDGTPIFKSEADEQSESEIASLIEQSWKCQCHSFGKLAPIDWFFVRDGRLVGVGELKTRSHDSQKHSTVFLNVRKWLALHLAASGLGVPAVFVVRFTNETRWIDINKINASAVRLGGCKKIVKSRNDIEPVIEVPIHTMPPLTQ